MGVVKATLTRPDRQDPDLTAGRLLDVLVAHTRTNPTVVVFDELSSITRVDGAAGLLRTTLQPHYQHIGLLFAGSEPSTMRMLFTGADQPFYAQADLVDIEPLTLAAVVELIDDGFASTPPPGLAGRIHAFTGGHPQRSMQLADAVWFAVADGIDAVAVWETTIIPPTLGPRGAAHNARRLSTPDRWFAGSAAGFATIGACSTGPL